MRVGNNPCGPRHCVQDTKLPRSVQRKSQLDIIGSYPIYLDTDLNRNSSRDDALCYGLHVCFPSLPSMLLCGFGSRLRLESSGFSMWHFLKLAARGFLRVLRFPLLFHRLMIQPIKKKLKQTRFQLCQT